MRSLFLSRGVTGRSLARARNCLRAHTRAVSPATSGTHGASGTVGHRQVILRPESRRVSLACGRCDRVRDRAAADPASPYVLNACAAALRGSGSNGMT